MPSRRDAIALIVAGVGFWWLRIWQTAGERIQLFANLDALTYWIPLLREAAAQWRSGALPLWNPYQALGTPLLATQQIAAIYPLNALYLICDTGTAWLLTGLVHHVIAALGMYAFCRILSLSRGAAVVGAASYAYSGIVINKYVDLPDEFICLAWLPAMFACAESLLTAPRVAAMAGLAGVWGLHILGGDADTIARAALLLGGYVAVRLANQLRASPRRALTAGAACVVAAGLALALTALQWMPTLELLRHSARAFGTLTAAQQSGFSADPWVLFTSRVRGVATPSIGSSLPLVLALIGLWTWPQRLIAWFFAVAAVTLAALSAGPATPLLELVRQLPTGTWFRVPLRVLNLWPLCIATLAAAGTHQLFGGAERGNSRVLRAAAGSAILVLAVKVVLAVRSGTASVWLVVAAFDLVPVLFLAVMAKAAQQSRAARSYAPLLAVVLVCAAPAALYQPDTLSPYRASAMYGQHAELFAQLREQAPARVLSLLPVADGRSWAKLGTYFEVPVLNDFEPLSLASFATFAHALRGEGEQPASLRQVLDVFTGETAPPRQRFDAALLNLSGVRFIVTDASTEPQLARWFGAEVPLALWRRSPQGVVYENAAAFPRAFFVAAGGARDAGSDCVGLLRGAGFDPASELLLDAAPSTAGRDRHHSGALVRISRYAPSEVRLAVSGDEAGFVVLTDAFYPGWTARVDGGAAAIVRADCFFRAVAVAAGSHEVVFRYMPQSFARGSIVSLTAAGLIAVVLITRRRAQRRPPGTIGFTSARG